MSSHSCGPVAAGRPYPVATVNGCVPSALSDFLGPVVVSIGPESEGLRLAGIGASGVDGVHFNQKDDLHGGRDVRVWKISGTTEDGFAATSESVY